MLIEDVTSAKYDNWTRHSEATMKSDFEEYKVKEEKKWLERAHRMGFRFPIFDDYDHYREAVSTSPVVTVTPELWDKVNNLTKYDDLDDIRSLVSTYVIPRDVDKIADGIENNHQIPYPVILKGDEGYFIMSGNTRLNVANTLGAIPRAILIDAR